MKSNVIVSVIVPIYNVEKYLGKCVESICSQTYENIQILLIDDGSMDNSGAMCDALALEDCRIQVFHKENEGLGLTRNFGIKHAIGDYIFFVDSDDYIEKDSIARMLEEAVSQDADLVVEGYKKVSDDGRILFEEKYKYEIFEGANVKNSFLPRMIGSCPEKKDSIFTTVCSKLYKRKIVVQSGVCFHSERKLQSEDLAFQLELLPFFSKVVVTSYAGYFYRTNYNSLTTIYKANRFEESKKVYLFVKEKIEELDLPKETRFRADKMLFVQVKAVIKQENPRVCQMPIWKCRRNVKEILSDELLQQEIENYPIRKLSPKQRIFMWLLKYKLAILVMIGVQVEK